MKNKRKIFLAEIPHDNQNAIILLFIKPAEREKEKHYLFIHSL